MRTAFFSLLFLTTLLLSVSTGLAGVTVVWEQAPNTEWGTKIYIGTESSIYTYSEDAGVNTAQYTIENLEGGMQYYFTATHYDNRGNESVYAPEISWEYPPVTFNSLPPIPNSDINTYTITISIPK